MTDFVEKDLAIFFQEEVLPRLRLQIRDKLKSMLADSGMIDGEEVRMFCMAYCRMAGEKMCAHLREKGLPISRFFQKQIFYLTASFRFLPALNFGARIAGTSTISPVLGFRAFLAFLSLTENVPKPEIETSSPFLRVLVIVSKTSSTMSSAAFLVPPIFSFMTSTSIALFMLEFFFGC